MAEILGGPGTADASDEEARLVANAKKITLMSIGLAYQKYLEALEKQQEVMMGIADMMMETFAMESSLLRARKLTAAGKGANAADMITVFLRDAMSRIELSARHVLGACSEGDGLRTNMAVLRRLAKYDPVNAVALRRQIAARLLARDRFVA